MQEVAHLDEFCIVADVDRTTTPKRVLKQGDSFAVFDQYGDIPSAEAAEEGLYHDGTRFLSLLELLFYGKRALLLSSTVSDDNVVFTADLTNPDVRRGDRAAIGRGSIHLFRTRVIWNGRWVERIRISNYAIYPVEAPVSFRFDSDFADVFEVRGTRRLRRGERLADACGTECVLPYRGLDGRERRTRLRWQPQPDAVRPGLATFVIRLAPHETRDIELSVSCEIDEARSDVIDFNRALRCARDLIAARGARGAALVSSNEGLNRWVRRSTADLQMMLTDTSHGLYPYAGIPWFSTPFGRDGIVTALETLWTNPDIARGVLLFLADTQATARSDPQDAQPGRILHEMRRGEMAALGEVPFGRYYGSADATPLFVVLAHAYFERTGDRPLVDRLWPHILAALNWLATDGDPDQDGFVEYFRQSVSGLVQQGWKDSHDSVFHADGSFAEPPIALCEVQGYAYAAWNGAADLAAIRGDAGLAEEWRARANRLRERFETEFWCEEIDTYALALDGRKQPCRVRTSNPGHCLFGGIASPERARRVASALVSDSSFGGWGIRTVAASEARYNPMSYHNGSLWPHDNALIAAGMARYGIIGGASRILQGIFDLSQAVDLNRLPELICGFHRRGGELPTLYPVACAPQAWAAGAVYSLIASCLGLRIDAPARRIFFDHAALPESIDWLRITKLAVNGALVDLHVERQPHDVDVTVLRREGDVDVDVMK